MRTILAVLLVSFSVSLALASPPQRIVASGVVLWVQSDGSVLASGEVEPIRGDQQAGDRNHFEKIVGLENIVAVSLARDGNCAAAIDKDGHVWTWGQAFGPKSEAKAEETVADWTPVLHDELGSATSVSLSSDHLVALGKDKRVRILTTSSSYDNEYGQLGTGDFEHTHRIVELPNIADAVAVAAVESNTFVLRADGSVWGMGYGLLLGSVGGAPTTLALGREAKKIASPTRMRELSNIVAISITDRFALALDRDGNVWGWGLNDSGQLGLPADDLKVVQPRKLAGLTSIKEIAAGYDFTLALRKDGKVLAQGCNVHGTLGDKREELEGKQRIVPLDQPAKRIYAGFYNAFADLQDGTFAGWGANDPSVGGFHAGADRQAVTPVVLDPTRRPPP